MYRLRLVNNDGTDSLDLLNGPLRVMNWGWNTKPANLTQNVRKLPFGTQANSLGFEPQVESLNLAQFDCDEAIRAAIKKLEVFLANAAAYMDDPINNDSQWIEWVTQGEGIKHSLLTGGSWVPTSRQGSWPLLSTGNIIANAALNRHPLWENGVYSNHAQDNMSSVGGLWALTNTAGRVPARIALMRFFPGDAFVVETLTKVWCGFRPKYYGYTSFNPVWECESSVGAGAGHSVLDVDTADSGPDALYSNNYTAQTTFGVGTVMNRRLFIDVWHVLGGTGVNAKHFAGRYLVLCRAWVDTGSCALQMRSGYGEGATNNAGELVTVTNTNALYKELGEIQIPTPGQFWVVPATGSLDQNCQHFRIELWAQNINATTLDMDCLVLIPLDYFAKLENANIYQDQVYPTDSKATDLFREPNERVVAVVEDDNFVVIEPVTASVRQWYLPIGDSVFVIAAERATEQVIADTLNVQFAYYPRWQSYRD